MSFPFPRPYPGPSMVSFSVLSLFSSGEQGAWYDPSDFSTMFQDSAGTTPVTAVEQPVGLLLDKRNGVPTLGSDIVTNGTFAADASWTKGTSWTISGGTANAGGTGSSLTQAISLNANSWYYVTYTVVSITLGNIKAQFQGGSASVGVTRSSPGTYTELLSSSNNNTLALVSGGTTPNAVIDNVTVRELPGNHASQSTAASRPVLSARVNLLTYSEQFDNAVWASTLGGVGTVTKSTTNAGTAPDGTTTADRVIFSLNGGTAATDIALLRQGGGGVGAYTFSIAAKSFDGTSSYTMQIILPDGTAQSITVTGAWQRFTVSGTAAGVVNYGLRLRGGQAPTNSDTADVLLWGADLRVTNDGVGLPAYQRVAAATDYDTSGFPLYLKFDGTDDSLATASIDFTATDKMSVFAGVRKLSDAASGCVAELTVNADTTNGGVLLFAPYGVAANFGYASRGTTTRATSPITYTAPLTVAISGISSISEDINLMRINGAQVASTALDQGTGNYANAPLYIGRRNNASLPYNGNLYSLIVRGARSTDAQIASTETYVNNLTKAY